MAARTPLFDRHVAAGAIMVDFGGFDMPQQYTNIREEHQAVRRAAGLFDVSHMGEVRLTGHGALTTLQQLCANDVSRLHDGQALYGVMCNDRGGIVDDIIIYRDSEADYQVVINAACRDKDIAWIRSHLTDHTQVSDESGDVALLALQGPRAAAMLRDLCSADPGELRPFHRMANTVAGVEARVSRTGYTGEDGFELYLPADSATLVWDALVGAGESAGLRLCGLGARDTLRLEAGLRLYGQDMDDTTDPFSCGLGWTVKLGKGIECIGASALSGLDRKNPPRRFIGLRLTGRAIARHGQPVTSGGAPVGEITSGTFSFTLGCGIATASVDPSVDLEAPFAVNIRGSATPVSVVPLPFYRRPATPGGP